MRLFNCQLASCNVGNRGCVYAGKDASHKRHIPAGFFDVFGERVIIVVNSMLVNCSIGMPMNDDKTTPTVRVSENKAKIVVTSVPGRRLRCGDKYALQRKGHRGSHHDNDGHPLEECS